MLDNFVCVQDFVLFIDCTLISQVGNYSNTLNSLMRGNNSTCFFARSRPGFLLCLLFYCSDYCSAIDAIVPLLNPYLTLLSFDLEIVFKNAYYSPTISLLTTTTTTTNTTTTTMTTTAFPKYRSQIDGISKAFCECHQSVIPYRYEQIKVYI